MYVKRVYPSPKFKIKIRVSLTTEYSEYLKK